MPYRFKRRPRRKPYRKRRFFRRRRRVHRPLRSGTLITKQYDSQIINIAATALPNDFQPFYQTFSLDQIDPVQLAAWQRCFSQFRILGVKMTFMPILSPNTATATETSLCTLYTATTTSSVASAADWITEQNALTTGNIRKKLFGRYTLSKPIHSVAMRPRAHYLVANPGVPLYGSALARPNQWLNIQADTSTPHAGIRYATQFDPPHPELEIKIITSYIIQFRNVI